MPAWLLTFLAVVAVLTLTPGPEMALVLRTGVRGGSPAAWWTGLGRCADIAVRAAASAVGLVALLVASLTAFIVLKLVRAAYLVDLGLMALWHSRRRPGPAPAAAAEAGTADLLHGEAAFRQGLVSDLLNPKIALNFLTLIPQVVAADEPVRTTAVLAADFLAVAVVWWRTFSPSGGEGGPVPRARAGARAIDRLTAPC